MNEMHWLGWSVLYALPAVGAAMTAPRLAIKTTAFDD
jgi:hypothetical protein